MLPTIILALGVLTTDSGQAVALPDHLSRKTIGRDTSTGFDWDPEALKVAAIRYPPHNWAYPETGNTTWFDYNLNKTIDKAIELIHQAAAEGVKFITFPEVYFPGYAHVLSTSGLGNNQLPKDYAQYATQCMEFDGPEWRKLMQAFAATKTYGVVGWTEKDQDSLYIAQTLVGPFANGSASALHRHRKVRASGGERNLWSDGDITSIRTTKLPFGSVSMLSCFENTYVDTRFVAASQTANIHVASFPYGVDTTPEDYSLPPYATFRTVAQAYGIGAQNDVTMLPCVGAATIFGQRSIIVNETIERSIESVEATPYLTAIYNTSTWSAPVRSPSNEFSWGAVTSILRGIAGVIPATDAPFWGYVKFTIEQISSAFVQTPNTECTATDEYDCIQIWPERNQTAFMA